jgi:hypothetical protein
MVFTAKFTPVAVNYTLTLNAGTGGTATADKTGAQPAGTVVTITAAPNAGYNFVNWTGNVANATANPTTVTLNANETVTANFAAAPACKACIVNPPAEVVVGQAFTWDASCSTGTDIISYSWAFSVDGAAAGTQGGVTSPKTFNNAGAGKVDLTITTSGGCTNTVSHTFNIVAQPTCVAVAKIAADKTTGVDPLAVTLNSAPGSTTGAGITYKWEITKGGSPVSSSTNASYLYSFNAGTYTVKLTVTNTADGNCVGTDQITITVTPATGYKPGDADLDGEVDIFDALKVAMHVAQMSIITDANLLAALDVNEDTKVDINDALAIAKYDVGLDCGCVLNR